MLYFFRLLASKYPLIKSFLFAINYQFQVYNPDIVPLKPAVTERVVSKTAFLNKHLYVCSVFKDTF